MTRDQFIDETLGLLDMLDSLLEAGTMARKERTRRPLEKTMAGKVARLFRAQGNSFLAAFAALKSQLPSGDETITEAAKELDWERYYNPTTKAASDALLAAIADGVGDALTAGANGLIADLRADMSFNLKNPRAVAYIKARGAENVTAINDTTREYLRTVITEGVEQGWSYGRLAARIRERFEEFADGTPITASRAQLIAVTEAGMAYEAGSRVVVDDLAEGGLEMEKSWLTANDGKVSDGCIENEADGWIAFDEPHSSGDMNPLRFPGCRCSEIYRRKGAE